MPEKWSVSIKTGKYPAYGDEPTLEEIENTSTTFLFDDEQDATLFALRWAGVKL